MQKKSELFKLMQEPLPSITKQKRLGYRTSHLEVVNLYKLLNYTIFNNELSIPELEVIPRCRRYWGMCFGSVDKIPYRNTYCKIRVMDKWYSKQWLITILAHEMCHQYQWDIQGKPRWDAGKDSIMSHGPSFFVFRDKLSQHGITLKKGYSRVKWFKHQIIL